MEIHDLTSASSEQRAEHSAQLKPWILVICSLFAVRSALFAAVPDGYIVKADTTTVYLDWGKASGVASGDQFKVYRQGEPLKHPVTGEVLGHSEQDLGQGVIDNVEDKFSTGKLIETKGAVKAGDRTRYTSTEQRAPSPVSQPNGLGAQNSVLATVPKEIWRSEPAKHEATGLAIGDVIGDGKKELVVSYRDQVEVFQWDGQKLVSLAVFKSRAYGNYLAVETADLDGAGHDKIFASYYIEGFKRARTVVLEYAQGTIKEVARLDGFVRAFGRMDGKRELLWQDISLSKELHIRAPAPVVYKDKKYKDGAPIKLVRALNNDQLFGLGWGDWDGDGAEDFAFLQYGERLRLFFKDAKWSSENVYGGTKTTFGWEDDQIGEIYPRLTNLKVGTGKLQLLVPHNIQITPIRLARLRIYKESELLDLAWNGLEMATVWRIPVSGALADYAVGDVAARAGSQVWIAAVGAGDKTILLGYSLP